MPECARCKRDGNPCVWCESAASLLPLRTLAGSEGEVWAVVRLEGKLGLKVIKVRPATSVQCDISE